MDERGLMTRGDKIEQVVIHIILIIFSLCAILPFVLLISGSFTDESTLTITGYKFWPSKWSIYAYEYLFITNGANILRAVSISVFITVFGTTLSLLTAPMLAYVLSRRDYKRASIMSFFVIFTMLFNGGIVPSYMMWNNLFGIKNTIWALVFPNLVMNGFIIVIMKNYFTQNIHPALIEAAKIDGANELHIYFRVVLPLSQPILATVGLMIRLGYWNDWINGLYYITDTKLYSLQVMLSSILMNAQALMTMGSSAAVGMKIPSVSIRMAIAVVGTVPIIILYPFFQKYFIKGITLGGVKE